MVSIIRRGKFSVKDNVKQQVAYASLMLGLWLPKGESVWSYVYEEPVMTDLKLNNRYVDTKELSDYAIQCKRNGDYAEAIGAYLRTMNACINKTHHIPVAHIRGLFKVLLCVNEFALAFQIISTVYADMLNTARAVDPQEKMLFQQYFSQMIQMIVAVVDDNNYAWAEAIAKNYAGSPSYAMQKSNSEIKENLNPIRANIKQIYGI